LAFIFLRLLWCRGGIKNPPIPKQLLFICLFVLHPHYTIPFKTAQPSLNSIQLLSISIYLPRNGFVPHQNIRNILFEDRFNKNLVRDFASLSFISMIIARN